MTATFRKSMRGYGSGAAAFAIAALACPGNAFAEESSTGLGAILPQMNEFIPMLVAFLVLWFVLAKFGWPYFEQMLDAREKTISNSLEKAEADRQESERLLAEHKKQLNEARSQAASIISEAKKSAEDIQSQANKAAQAESAEMIEKARVTIEAQKEEAAKQLQSSIADTSVAIAARVIGTDLGDAEHRKIIERYVNEAFDEN